MSENEKGPALLTPLLATGLTQLFTLLGVINKMIQILHLCLNSFLDFISSVSMWVEIPWTSPRVECM